MPISNKEIMRGSIVLYEGKVRQVKAVSELILLEGEKAWIGASLMDGEPLTEKWLTDFGFEWLLPYHRWVNNKGYEIQWYTAKGNWFVCTYTNERLKTGERRFEFVHQLQAHYFTTTSEHLNIPKLPK